MNANTPIFAVVNNVDVFASIARYIEQYRDYNSLTLVCREYSNFSLTSDTNIWYMVSLATRTHQQYQQSFLRNIHTSTYRRSIHTGILAHAYSELRDEGTRFLFRVITVCAANGYDSYFIFKDACRVKPLMKEFLVSISPYDKEMTRAALTNDREGCLKYSYNILSNSHLYLFVDDTQLLIDMIKNCERVPYNMVRLKISDDDLLLAIDGEHKWRCDRELTRLLQEYRPHIASIFIERGSRQRVRYMGSVELYLACEKYKVDFRRKNNRGWKDTRRIVEGIKESYKYDVRVSPVMLEYIHEVAPERMPKRINYMSIRHESIERLEAIMSYTSINWFIVDQEDLDDILHYLCDVLFEGGHKNAVMVMIQKLIPGSIYRYHLYDFRYIVATRRAHLLEPIPDVEEFMNTKM